MKNKTHYSTGDNVPACRNSINPRGRAPSTTSDITKVTCDKCLASHSPSSSEEAASVETTKLTANEVAVLRACYASEYNDGQDTPSPWSWSVTAHSGLKPKSVSGVIASLVKKGIVTSHGEGTKDDDNYVQVTDAGFQLALSLGLIVEKQGKLNSYYDVVETPAVEAPAAETKPAAKKTTKSEKTASQAPDRKNARRIIRAYLHTAIEIAMLEEDGADADAILAAKVRLSEIEPKLDAALNAMVK